jgi:hypothetical protein
MIVILLLAMVAWPSERVRMNTPPAAAELELSIRTEKPEYALGEAVWLDVGLRNTGRHTIHALKYFMLPADDPGKNTLEIHLHDAAGHRISRVSHVMTGRAINYPQIIAIDPGETYRESRQLAGTFPQQAGSTRERRALWSFGENPAITSASEYPAVTPGIFRVHVSYHVDTRHMVSLSEATRSTVWEGRLISNTIEIAIV